MRRAVARDSLLGFTRYTFPRYAVAPMHQLICEKLERVERGECKRLMIFTPPRHGKSELVSRRWPARYIGKFPTAQFISASYGDDLATDFGRDVRNIVASEEYRRLYPGTVLSHDSAAKGKWHTTAGGIYISTSVGKGVTGRGADVLNIDDPIKDRIEAESETVRKNIWDWYTSTAYTRLMPGGAIVLTMTRWHEDDLAGKLLEAAKGGADQWEVIDLPALANSSVDPLGRQIDAPLWPERYDADALAKIRAAIGTRDWSALYQQSPSPETGSYFLKDWLRPVPTLPPRESLRVFGASDYAVTSDGGDYTVHIVLGVDSDDRLYVLDLWRGQASSDQWVEAFCDLVVRWKPMGWAEETGQIRAGIGPWLDRRSRERRAFVAREAFPTRGDKSVRAQSIRGRAALNGLYLPAGAPWRADFEAELLSFPAGRHDDQVDALGLVGQLLDVMMPPGKPKPPEKPVDSWAKAFARSDYEDNDWKTA
jgi:predicted phage terminase large subunit-like protein